MAKIRREKYGQMCNLTHANGQIRSPIEEKRYLLQRSDSINFISRFAGDGETVLQSSFSFVDDASRSQSKRDVLL